MAAHGDLQGWADRLPGQADSAPLPRRRVAALFQRSCGAGVAEWWRGCGGCAGCLRLRLAGKVWEGVYALSIPYDRAGDIDPDPDSLIEFASIAAAKLLLRLWRGYKAVLRGGRPEEAGRLLTLPEKPPPSTSPAYKGPDRLDLKRTLRMARRLVAADRLDWRDEGGGEVARMWEEVVYLLRVLYTWIGDGFPGMAPVVPPLPRSRRKDCWAVLGVVIPAEPSPAAVQT